MVLDDYLILHGSIDKFNIWRYTFLRRCVMHLKNKEHIEKLCNEANKVFIGEALSDYPKYKYLPTWLKNKSLYLNRERCNCAKQYRVYKRGSIVYVDFGINVGYELSGNHFAIVVNNHDNPKNGVLSVIPLSSKDKKNYLPLGPIINLSSIKHFIAESDKFSFRLKVFVLCSIHYGKVSEDALQLSSVKKAPDITTEEALVLAKKFGYEFTDNNTIKKTLNELEETIEEHKKVFTIYQKYTKDCFAMPSNIQTISKMRIKKINKYDPSGKMKVNATIMSALDDALLKNLTKK
ncbi:type II toxin-antitoxin system PemK/MazF family toxin [Enterococcus faecalis]|nr:type II toxin-antitoxin system PemK/MazF family toxin [Enterococcus faecalis]